MTYSRRELGKLALAALPASAAFHPARLFAAPNSRFGGVQISAITYSFWRDVKDPAPMLPNLVKIGVSAVELMSDDAERLAGAPLIPGLGAGGVPRPKEDASVAEGRRKRAEWRKSANAATFQRVRKMFDDAGVNLALLCYNMAATIQDDEIEHAFNMARALGVRAMSSTSTVAVARRVAPFADKHKILWGGHNHADVKNPNEFASLASFETILGMSKYFGANLDIGHFTAANLDAVSFIRKNHTRITNIHLKDRKRNDGPNVPWGQGDTPIKDVLQLLKKEKYPFPASIEFEYPIPPGSNSTAELAKCLDYARKCLEG